MSFSNLFSLALVVVFSLLSVGCGHTTGMYWAPSHNAPQIVPFVAHVPYGDQIRSSETAAHKLDECLALWSRCEVKAFIRMSPKAPTPTQATVVSWLRPSMKDARLLQEATIVSMTYLTIDYKLRNITYVVEYKIDSAGTYRGTPLPSPQIAGHPAPQATPPAAVEKPAKKTWLERWEGFRTWRAKRKCDSYIGRYGKEGRDYNLVCVEPFSAYPATPPK